MKTNSIIKHTATLLSAAALLALPAHAVQNFNKTHSSSTGDSNFGAVATFNVYDNEIAPSGTIPGSYAVTASGNVVGKVLGGSVTALSGTGTVKALSNGTGTFSGNLSALGYSLFNVSNRALPYTSSHFIRSWSASKSIPFSIAFIPFNVTGKVNASIDAYFRVDTTYTNSLAVLGGIPKLDIKMGPVADMAASAEASVGVGIDGLAELSVGATGSLRLGKAAITASAVISPTYPMLAQLAGTATTLELAGSTSTLGTMTLTAPTTTLSSTTTRTTSTSTLTSTTAVNQNGAQVTIALTASTSGINGTLEIFAEADFFFGSKRVSETIASYSSGSASVNLLGPVTYTWF
jgi:hypothetical protein